MRQWIANFLDDIKETVIKILLSLAGALFIALATIVLIAPNSVREFIEGIPLALRILMLLGIYAIAGFIVYQEFVLGGKPPVKGLVIKGSGGAVTSLDVESVHDRIVQALENLSGIDSVDVTVKSVRGKADIEARVRVSSASINVPDKEKEIVRSLRQVVEKQLGVRLAENPRVEILLKDDGRRKDKAAPKEVETAQEKPEPVVDEVEKPAPSDVDEEDDSEFWDFLQSTTGSEGPASEDSGGDQNESS